MLGPSADVQSNKESLRRPRLQKQPPEQRWRRRRQRRENDSIIHPRKRRGVQHKLKMSAQKIKGFFAGVRNA